MTEAPSSMHAHIVTGPMHSSKHSPNCGSSSSYMIVVFLTLCVVGRVFRGTWAAMRKQQKRAEMEI